MILNESEKRKRCSSWCSTVLGRFFACKLLILRSARSSLERRKCLIAWELMWQKVLCVPWNNFRAIGVFPRNPVKALVSTAARQLFLDYILEEDSSSSSSRLFIFIVPTGTSVANQSLAEVHGPNTAGTLLLLSCIINHLALERRQNYETFTCRFRCGPAARPAPTAGTVRFHFAAYHATLPRVAACCPPCRLLLVRSGFHGACRVAW